MTKSHDIWECTQCGQEQGRHDMWFEGDLCGNCKDMETNIDFLEHKSKPQTKTFYFNSGVKPWNTDVERQIQAGNKFINGELHHPFEVSSDVPDGSILISLMDEPFEHYNEKYFIIAEVLGGNMHSKYAVFHRLVFNQ